MDIHELFETYASDHLDIPLDVIRASRLTNGFYSHPRYSAAFRMFKAGFEANQGEKMRVIGYLSAKEVQNAEHGEETYLCKIPMPGARIEVFVKQCEPLKLEMNHEKQ